MARKTKRPAEILESWFSKPEWEYLKHQKSFMAEWKKGCDTLEDAERLSVLGDQLIHDWEIAHPEDPPFAHARRSHIKRH